MTVWRLACELCPQNGPMKIKFQPPPAPLLLPTRQALEQLQQGCDQRLTDDYVRQLASSPQPSLPCQWAAQVRGDRTVLNRLALESVVAGVQGPTAAVVAYLARQLVDQPEAVHDSLQLIARQGEFEERQLAELALYTYGLTAEQSQAAAREAFDACVRGADPSDYRKLDGWLPSDSERRLYEDDYSPYDP